MLGIGKTTTNLFPKVDLTEFCNRHTQPKMNILEIPFVSTQKFYR